MHLIISSTVNNILKKNGLDDHPIRYLITHYRESKKDFDFIEVENEDYLSFISNSKIEKLHKIEKSDYFNGDINSYMSRNPHSCWTMYRNTIKIGRFIKHIVDKNYDKFLYYKNRNFYYKNKNDSETIETFVNSFKAIIKELNTNIDEKISFISGEDIRFYYDGENYKYSGGTLNNSCMRYKRCQSYLDIYVKNPDKCKLMIYRENTNSSCISGRALIWQLEDGTTYMDRIYSTDEIIPIIFINYARKNNWHYYDSLSSPYSGEDLYNKFFIKLNNISFDYYPYMDTFKYLNYNTGELKSIRKENSEYELMSQYGNIDTEHDEEYYDDDDSY